MDFIILIVIIISLLFQKPTKIHPFYTTENNAWAAYLFHKPVSYSGFYVQNREFFFIEGFVNLLITSLDVRLQNLTMHRQTGSL